MMSYPGVRLRRLRRTPVLRKMMQRVKVFPSDLICPIFIDENAKEPIPIKFMPGYSRLPVKKVVDEAKSIVEQGVKAVLLFGLPEVKDEKGSQAYAPNGIVQKTVIGLKQEFGDELVVMTDLCLCEYTSHGHCGIVEKSEVKNDATLEVYRKVAVSQAQAGADVVAPSGMMDGQVKAIRSALDDAGFDRVGIMAYSSKFASCLYGPFRDAAECAPQFGDRKSYQMGFGNIEEALREIELDVNEGADIIMIKPALAYMDIIHAARSRFSLPVAAYSVSGEYSMVKAAGQNGWIDEKAAINEILTGIKRAGADLIITYFAKDIGAWLNQE
jgi:porphobilinogen synthase